jgi:hypothetical protein
MVTHDPEAAKKAYNVRHLDKGVLNVHAWGQS